MVNLILTNAEFEQFRKYVIQEIHDLKKQQRECQYILDYEIKEDPNHMSRAYYQNVIEKTKKKIEEKEAFLAKITEQKQGGVSVG